MLAILLALAEVVAPRASIQRSLAESAAVEARVEAGRAQMQAWQRLEAERETEYARRKAEHDRIDRLLEQLMPKK